MIPRKFVAATSREALYKVREALGEEAIILSNKQVPGGVEIIAVSEHEMDAFAHEAHAHSQEPAPFAAPEWPRYPEPGIGAAAHYQHWQTVSWNAYADEESEWQPEPEPELQPHYQPQYHSQPQPQPQRSSTPMSSLNNYWHNQTQNAPVAASAPASMAVSAQGGAPSWMAPQPMPPASMQGSAKRESVSAASGEGRSAPLPHPQSGQRGGAMMSEPQSGMNGRMAGERTGGSMPGKTSHQAQASSRPGSDDRSRSGARPGSSSGASSAQPVLRAPSVPYSSDTRADSRETARGNTRENTQGNGQRNAQSNAATQHPSHGGGRPASSSQAAPSSFPSSSASHEEPLIQHELKLLRSLLEGQLAGFAWNELSQRTPLHLTLMRWMLSAGISPSLARGILEDLPVRQDITEAMGQIRQQLSRRVECMSPEEDIIDRGGVYALVGTTGVGKTTTVAKLAARCTLKHGPQHVALLTTDSYRIGAHDQLKAYGRILSVPVYGIRDETDLVSALSDLSTRRLILIDTIGMSQRDRRLVEQIALLGRQGGKVQQLLLIAANAQASTLEDVVRAYGSSQLTGVIISKMDETCQIGSVVDMLIRHRLRLCYMTDGQRVPEDLHLPNAKALVDRAFQDILSDSPLALNEDEYPLIWK